MGAAGCLTGRLSSFGFSGTIAHGAFACSGAETAGTLADTLVVTGAHGSLIRASRGVGAPEMSLARKLVVMWLETVLG